MRRPERDLPWALIITMAATTAIYMGVAFSATGAGGWQALSTSQAPLALVPQPLLFAHSPAPPPGARGGGAGPGLPGGPAALVLAIAAGLVLIGDLARAAEFTNAAM